MAILRVKPTVTAAIRLLDGSTFVLKGDSSFDSNDPVLAEIEKATGVPNDWFLQSDADAPPPKSRRGSGKVEQATAAPGEQR